MSTLKLDTLSNKAGTASVPSDTIVSGTAKAWVNFNGIGTVAIHQAFNVSSITDNGTGDYTINISTSFADQKYAVGTQCNSGNGGGNWGYPVFERVRSASSYRVMCSNTSYSVQDCENVSAIFLR